MNLPVDALSLSDYSADMKKTGAASKLPSVNANGFATKGDVKKLEKKMDFRFAQVDKRFAQVDKRFAQVDKRFAQVDEKLGSIDIRLGVFQLDWDTWKQDALTEFNSQWVNKIDPILAEIEKHREKELIWAEQNRRTDERTRRFEERLDKINQWIKEREKLELVWVEQNKRLEGKFDQFAEKLDIVAKKIGA